MFEDSALGGSSVRRGGGCGSGIDRPSHELGDGCRRHGENEDEDRPDGSALILMAEGGSGEWGWRGGKDERKIYPNVRDFFTLKRYPPDDGGVKRV